MGDMVVEVPDGRRRKMEVAVVEEEDDVPPCMLALEVVVAAAAAEVAGIHPQTQMSMMMRMLPHRLQYHPIFD